MRDSILLQVSRRSEGELGLQWRLKLGHMQQPLKQQVLLIWALHRLNVPLELCSTSSRKQRNLRWIQLCWRTRSFGLKLCRKPTGKAIFLIFCRRPLEIGSNVRAQDRSSI